LQAISAILAAVTHQCDDERIGSTKDITFKNGFIGVNFYNRFIVQVLPGTPAEKAGVHKGWRILRVNGEAAPNDDSMVLVNCFSGDDTSSCTLAFAVYPNDMDLESIGLAAAQQYLPSALSQFLHVAGLQNQAGRWTFQRHSALQLQLVLELVTNVAELMGRALDAASQSNHATVDNDKQQMELVRRSQAAKHAAQSQGRAVGYPASSTRQAASSSAAQLQAVRSARAEKYTLQQQNLQSSGVSHVGAAPHSRNQAVSSREQKVERKTSQYLSCRSLELHVIRFTQSSISGTFRDGRRVEDTVQQLRSGALQVQDLPRIRVVEFLGMFWTLDNRRLHCIQQAFPKRSHAGKLISVDSQSLSDQKVKDEFFRKFTTGTTVHRRDL